MNDPEFALLDEIEPDHWWFVGKRLILRQLLGRLPGGSRLLDLGCGTGGVLRDWSARCACVGVDRSAFALEVCRRKGFASLVRCDLDRLPFAEAAFDAIVLLDVLEHLDDDAGFLRAAANACRPEGRVVISVPAFQFLWSRHDETFAHRRRYSAEDIRRVVETAGLVIERTTYSNFFVFPIASVVRPLSRVLQSAASRLAPRLQLAPKHDFWPVPRWVHRALVAAYRLEAWLLGRLDLPLGVSVVCVARRRGVA